MFAHLLLTATLLAAPAQRPDSLAPSTLQAVRVSGAAPTLDGRLDEAAWAEAPVATDFVQRSPNPGKPASQRTEARVLYDDQALYVGMRMFDSAPDSIAAQLARRDAVGIYSDWAHVMLDSYDDNRTAFRFAVNPRGVRKDVYHFDDGNEDPGWDAVWEVETGVDSLGWTAEFRIPLSQLRFRSRPGEQRWGLNLGRDIARTDERAFWAPLVPERPGFVSQFGTLAGLTDLPAARRLEVRPYTVARLTRAPGDPGDPFYEENDPGAAIGGDLQYGLSSDFTLTATLNPDFGQVEADPSQYNLSANELFFSERRPFFLEGADIFRFGIGLGDGNGETLFYSRRIGRTPQRNRFLGSLGSEYMDAPEQTTILGAAKLSGKTANGWSVGVLDAVTAEEHARYVLPTEPRIQSVVTEPLTNYAVARVRKDFRQGQSAVGAILTTTHRRLDGDDLNFLPSAAYAGGFDARHRFAGGDWEASGWVLGSRVQGDTLAIGRIQNSPLRYFRRPDADHLEFDPTRTSMGGTAASFGVSKIGGGNWRGGVLGLLRSPGFEANDLGFQTEADQTMAVGYLGYRQFEPMGPFRNWNLNSNLYGGGTWGGERTFTGANVNGSFQLENFWGGYAGVERSLGGLSTGALRGGPAILEPGGWGGWFGAYSDQRKAVSLGLNGNWGLEDETDGYRWSIGPEVEWRPSSQLNLALAPSLSRNRNAWQYVGTRLDAGAGDARRYLFGRLDQTTAALTARLNYTFSPDLSLQFYAQPFVTAGDYDGFLEVENPRADAFRDRMRAFDENEIRPCDGFFGVRAAREGCGEDAGFAYRFDDPDFNFKQFRSNAVLRWEYRPGSTFFVVWSQGRENFLADGSFGVRRDLGRLFDDTFAPSTNVLLLKLSYWLNL